MSLLTINTGAAFSEAEALFSLAKDDSWKKSALLDVFHRKGSDFLTWHQTLGPTPCCMEAVLCDEARALLQTWKGAA